MPTILGEEIPLFNSGNSEKKLKLKENKAYNGPVIMYFICISKNEPVVKSY